jgi:hypothetical protein
MKQRAVCHAQSVTRLCGDGYRPRPGRAKLRRASIVRVGVSSGLEHGRPGSYSARTPTSRLRERSPYRDAHLDTSTPLLRQTWWALLGRVGESVGEPLWKRRLAEQGGEFLPRPLDDLLQISNKIGVYRIVTCLESLDCFFTAADEDREQRDFLLVRVSFDPRFLPR